MWWQLWKEWWGEGERKRDSNRGIYNCCDIVLAPNIGTVFTVLPKRIENKKEMGGERRGEGERKKDSNRESASVRRKRDSNPSNPPPYLSFFGYLEYRALRVPSSSWSMYTGSFIAAIFPEPGFEWGTVSKRCDVTFSSQNVTFQIRYVCCFVLLNRY